jgi:lysozyme family protein
MAPFDKALEHVLQFEGGRVDHPNDKGGRTAYGVTQARYDKYRHEYGGNHPKDVWDIQEWEVKDIYLFYYWQAGKCNYLPAPLDFLHFDACVNHGDHNAGRLLQRAITGIAVDGIVGEKTLAAADHGEILEICYRYLLHRMKFYHAICERHRDQRVFLTGWIARLVKLWKAAL